MKQIQVNIKLPSQTDLDKQLNDLIAKLKDKKIDLAINTKAFTTSLKEMESALGSLKTKLKDFDILSNATKGANSAKKDIQDISNMTGDLSKETNKFDAMGNLISSTKTFKDTFIQTTKVMSDGTSTVTQDFDKLNNKIADMQSKLNTASSNNLINPSVIENLQNKLNNVNTNTAESEIKELQTTINNLSSNDSGIVRLQNAINNLQNNLKNTRGKYGSLVDLNDLKNTTSEIDNLKNTLREVTNGKTIDSGKITSEINKANSSFKTLQTNAKTSGEALRVAQQDATSFGSAVSRAFANSGIFLTTATSIRAVTNELKNASSYIIELDERLTNIQMITGKSSSAVQSITNEFKNMGNQLHTTNSELMTGAEEVLRAGYDMNTAKQMMEASVIGAKISGQTTAEVTEQLIAIKNAFDMDGSQMNNVVDIISKMDDTSATSLFF